jgi:hypothetical protein
MAVFLPLSAVILVKLDQESDPGDCRNYTLTSSCQEIASRTQTVHLRQVKYSGLIGGGIPSTGLTKADHTLLANKADAEDFDLGARSWSRHRRGLAHSKAGHHPHPAGPVFRRPRHGQRKRRDRP